MKPNLNKLLKTLLEHKLPFVVIGGYASAMHGSSSVTFDLDICMSFSYENLEILKRALSAQHPFHRNTKDKLSILEEPPKLEECKNLYLMCDLGPLDVLSEIKGLGSYESVLPHAVTIDMFNNPCHVLSIEQLITGKQAMGRDKDKVVINQLKAIQKEKSTSS